LVQKDAGTGASLDAAASSPPVGDGAVAVQPTPIVDAAAQVASAEPDAGTAELTTTDGGVDEEEIEIDPTKVEDPDTAAGSAALPEDEEKDAPQTEEEVEKRQPTPPAPQLATTVHDAVLLIKAGKKELALASLQRLYKKQPNSGYIPFLLGNLYFDRTWWAVAMDYYRTAIKKNAGYRSNATLNRNVIHMLASNKTRNAATNFLRGVIGHPAAYHLRYAAAHEQNSVVRQRAKELSRYIR
jgi:predicted Zn-dependent protease